jgi:hypothetical protein
MARTNPPYLSLGRGFSWLILDQQAISLPEFKSPFPEEDWIFEKRGIAGGGELERPFRNLE